MKFSYYLVLLSIASCLLGTKIVSAQDYKRIVVLQPSLAELVWELDGKSLKRLVGTVEYSDYPSEMGKLPKVGSYFKVNLERVMSLSPDLVLASKDGNDPSQIERLIVLGKNVVVVEPTSFLGIFDSILKIGTALNRQDQAKIIVTKMRRELDLLKGVLSKESVERKVLIQVGSEPIVVAGTKTFLSESMQWLGLKNIVAQSNLLYPRPTRESILGLSPDLILVFNLGGLDKSAAFEVKKWNMLFENSKGKSPPKVLLIEDDRVLRPTSRLLPGLKNLVIQIKSTFAVEKL